MCTVEIETNISNHIYRMRKIFQNVVRYKEGLSIYAKPKAAARGARVKLTASGTLMHWSPRQIFSFAAGWYCKSSWPRRVLDQIGTDRFLQFQFSTLRNHHRIRASQRYSIATLQHYDIDVAWHCKFSAMYHDNAMPHSKNICNTANAATTATTPVARILPLISLSNRLVESSLPHDIFVLKKNAWNHRNSEGIPCWPALHFCFQIGQWVSESLAKNSAGRRLNHFEVVPLKLLALELVGPNSTKLHLQLFKAGAPFHDSRMCACVKPSGILVWNDGAHPQIH